VGSRLSVLLVSAVINPQGTPARVVEAVMSGRVVAVVTEGLLDELAAVLIRPKFRRWITVALAAVRPGPPSSPATPTCSTPGSTSRQSRHAT